MKCQKCNRNEATTHFTKIINGNKTEYHLCNDCAAESEEIQSEFNTAFAPKFGFNGFFNGLADDFGIPSLLGSAFFGLPSDTAMQSNRYKCSECGTSFEDFTKTNYLGCPNCYKTFENRLAKPLRQFHGNSEHVGKIPSAHESEISVNKRIKQLEEELNQDVLNQNFEHAATLRDEIKKLRDEL